MEGQPGEVTAFEGATKVERQLLYLYAKVEQHLFHTGHLTSILGREISEDGCDTRSIGENRGRMRRVADQLDYVLMLMRQALVLYNQLGRHIRIFQGIWVKRCNLDLLYHHLSATHTLIYHHLARDCITDQLLKVIADDMIYKSEQVKAWAESLEFTLKCIYRYQHESDTSDDPPGENSERAASTDSDRTPDRENGEELEDSDDPPGENSEDPMESVAPTDSIATRTRSHYPTYGSFYDYRGR
jgi:hypothetical protein